MLEPSSVKLAYNPGTRGFTGTTSNVSRLAIDVAHVPLGSLRFDLDGGRLRDVPRPSKGSRVYLERKQDGWAATDAPSLSRKGPHRYGPFKEAFRNRMIFVVGTKGTPEENAWAAAKARFDAETFWYRGNGAVDIVNDSDFDPNADRDRNVILYGRADTHASWKSLIGDGPISAVRGELRVGSRVEKGEDLACLFIRPRPGGDRALVAAVSGTGIVGFRQTDRLSYFVSGVAYPDVVVIGGDSLDAREQTFRGAGFFGDDWTVESGEFAWRGEDQVK